MDNILRKLIWLSVVPIISCFGMNSDFQSLLGEQMNGQTRSVMADIAVPSHQADVGSTEIAVPIEIEEGLSPPDSCSMSRCVSNGDLTENEGTIARINDSDPEVSIESTVIIQKRIRRRTYSCSAEEEEIQSTIKKQHTFALPEQDVEKNCPNMVQEETHIYQTKYGDKKLKKNRGTASADEARQKLSSSRNDAKMTKSMTAFHKSALSGELGFTVEDMRAIAGFSDEEDELLSNPSFAINSQRLNVSEDTDTASDRRHVLHHVGIPRSMPILTKFILSIDGGGTRGIIPLTFIEQLHLQLDDEIEERLPIDMFAGTSVGALIAVAEMMGKTHEVYDDFTNIAQQIFTRSFLNLLTFGLYGPKYTSTNKKIAIEDIIEGNEIEESAIKLLIPMYSYNTNENLLYSNRNPIVPLIDALMGTTAAPTYFSAHRCTTSDGKILSVIDGGVWQNNPAVFAYSQMRMKYPADRIHVISLGTGFSDHISNVDATPQSLISWGMNITNVTMGASSQSTDMLLLQLNERNPLFVYHRIQVKLEGDSCLLDCVDERHLTNLKNIAIKAVTNPTEAQYQPFQQVISLLREAKENRE